MDLYNELYYWNDNVTGQNSKDLMSEDCNARLEIRISKAMPILLNQFKGYQNSAKTRAMVCDVINYWFKTVVMAYGSSVQDWNCICDESNNPEEEIRQGKLRVEVQVR